MRTSCTPSPCRAIALATPFAMVSSPIDCQQLQTRPSVLAASMPTLSSLSSHTTRPSCTSTRCQSCLRRSPRSGGVRNASQHFLVALALRHEDRCGVEDRERRPGRPRCRGRTACRVNGPGHGWCAPTARREPAASWCVGQLPRATRATVRPRWLFFLCHMFMYRCRSVCTCT